jgi:pimeloyl-ACP methyl ester carboxylesterase
MKAVFLTAYQEMEHDPEFVAVGSVMGCVYADLYGMRCGHKHLFAYVPEHKKGQKLPIILFLHGSGGNFKAYLWTWKRFADAQQVAIVAPSFGLGNWDKDGGMEIIDAAYDFCAHNPELDANRIELAGLSNGGIGVSRAFARNPERYRGLLYISSVMEPDVMASPAFVQACSNKQILVLHGEQDERIPLEYVKEPLHGLSGKAKIETKYYPGEDHFLFLSKREEVMADVARWMTW